MSIDTARPVGKPIPITPRERISPIPAPSAADLQKAAKAIGSVKTWAQDRPVERVTIKG